MQPTQKFHRMSTLVNFTINLHTQQSQQHQLSQQQEKEKREKKEQLKKKRIKNKQFEAQIHKILNKNKTTYNFRTLENFSHITKRNPFNREDYFDSQRQKYRSGSLDNDFSYFNSMDLCQQENNKLQQNGITITPQNVRQFRCKKALNLKRGQMRRKSCHCDECGIQTSKELENNNIDIKPAYRMKFYYTRKLIAKYLEIRPFRTWEIEEKEYEQNKQIQKKLDQYKESAQKIAIYRRKALVDPLDQQSNLTKHLKDTIQKQLLEIHKQQSISFLIPQVRKQKTKWEKINEAFNGIGQFKQKNNITSQVQQYAKKRMESQKGNRIYGVWENMQREKAHLKNTFAYKVVENLVNMDTNKKKAPNKKKGMKRRKSSIIIDAKNLNLIKIQEQQKQRETARNQQNYQQQQRQSIPKLKIIPQQIEQQQEENKEQKQQQEEQKISEESSGEETSSNSSSSSSSKSQNNSSISINTINESVELKNHQNTSKEDSQSDDNNDNSFSSSGSSSYLQTDEEQEQQQKINQYQSEAKISTQKQSQIIQINNRKRMSSIPNKKMFLQKQRTIFSEEDQEQSSQNESYRPEAIGNSNSHFKKSNNIDINDNEHLQEQKVNPTITLKQKNKQFFFYVLKERLKKEKLRKKQEQEKLELEKREKELKKKLLEDRKIKQKKKTIINKFNPIFNLNKSKQFGKSSQQQQMGYSNQNSMISSNNNSIQLKSNQQNNNQINLDDPQLQQQQQQNTEQTNNKIDSKRNIQSIQSGGTDEDDEVEEIEINENKLQNRFKRLSMFVSIPLSSAASKINSARTSLNSKNQLQNQLTSNNLMSQSRLNTNNSNNNNNNNVMNQSKFNTVNNIKNTDNLQHISSFNKIKSDENLQNNQNNNQISSFQNIPSLNTLQEEGKQLSNDQDGDKLLEFQKQIQQLEQNSKIGSGETLEGDNLDHQTLSQQQEIFNKFGIQFNDSPVTSPARKHFYKQYLKKVRLDYDKNKFNSKDQYIQSLIPKQAFLKQNKERKTRSKLQSVENIRKKRVVNSNNNHQKNNNLYNTIQYQPYYNSTSASLFNTTPLKQRHNQYTNNNNHNNNNYINNSQLDIYNSADLTNVTKSLLKTPRQNSQTSIEIPKSNSKQKLKLNLNPNNNQNNKQFYKKIIENKALTSRDLSNNNSNINKRIEDFNRKQPQSKNSLRHSMNIQREKRSNYNNNNTINNNNNKTFNIQVSKEYQVGVQQQQQKSHKNYQNARNNIKLKPNLTTTKLPNI